MSQPAGTLEIQLLADMVRLQKDMRDVQRIVKDAMGNVANDVGVADKALQNFSRNGRNAVVSAGQQRAAMQQLSFQLGDVATMWSLGARPMQIFASQSGQVIQAFQMMSGSSRGLLGVLGGPWGMVLTAAVVALTPLVQKLLEADAAMGEVKEASSGLKDAQGALGDLFDLTTGKIKSQNDMLLLNAKLLALNLRNDALAKRAAFADARKSAGQYSWSEVWNKSLPLWKIFSQRQTPARDLLDQLSKGKIEANAAFDRALKMDLSGTGLNREELITAIRDLAEAEAKEKTAAEVLASVNEGKLAPSLMKVEKNARKAKKQVDEFAKSIFDTEKGVFGDINKMRADFGLDKLGIDGEQELKKAVDLAYTHIEARRDLAEYERNLAIDTAQDVAQIINNGVGGVIGDLATILAGLTNGNFRGVGGPIGGILQIMNSGDRNVFRPVTDKLDEIFGGIEGDGTFTRSMGKVLQNSGIGIAGATLLGGRGSALGGAFGGALGGKLGEKIGANILAAGGSKLLGSLAGPLGSLAGGLIGGALGGLFKKAKYGTAVISNVIDDASVRGNKSSYKANASTAAGSVQQGLQRIADEFGADLGDFLVSVGQYKGKWRVSTSGRAGKLKNKYSDVTDFGKDGAEEAIKFAIADAIRDGALLGLRTATKRLLSGDGDLDGQLEKALKFENVFRDLKRRTDPVGAAIDDLNREFEGLKKIFAEAGASAAEYADLQKLYELKRVEATQAANDNIISDMKDFLAELKGGSSSPLSAQLRYRNSREQLAILDAMRAQGQAVDFGKYQQAANDYLSASRDFNGSANSFWADFNKVTADVQAMIDAQNAQAAAGASGDLPSVNFTPVVNAVETQTNVTTALLQQISQQLAEQLKVKSNVPIQTTDPVQLAAIASTRYYRLF